MTLLTRLKNVKTAARSHLSPSAEGIPAPSQTEWLPSLCSSLTIECYAKLALSKPLFSLTD